jgi:hypothetical protein
MSHVETAIKTWQTVKSHIRQGMLRLREHLEVQLTVAHGSNKARLRQRSGWLWLDFPVNCDFRFNGPMPTVKARPPLGLSN